MSIPLSYFVDRSNLQQPKGLIVSDGLVSAMRNPLYDGGFQGQIIVDARFRDNWAHTPRHKTTNTLFTDSRRNDRLSQTGGNNDDTFATEFGMTTDITTAEDMRTDEFDTASHGVDEFNRENKNVVMSTAMYIPADVTLALNIEARGGLLTGGSSRAGWELHRLDGSSNEIRFLDIASFVSLHTLVSGDYGKFLNITFLRAGGSATSIADKDVVTRMIGGTNDTIISATNPSSDNQTSGLAQIPINNICNIAFSTIAIYSGNNDNGVDGLDATHINYDLFENEHVCNSYVASGNTINFTCENKVAFEIKSGSRWFNTNGTTGSGRRVFFNTGSRSIATQDFTQIRPVLKNSGLLNADTLGKLQLLSITSVSRASGGVQIIETNKSTLLETTKRDYTRFIVNNNDPTHTDTHFQLIFPSQSFANPIFSVKASKSNNLLKNGNLLKLTKKELRIIIRHGTKYKIRTRVLTSGGWSRWTVQSFRTRDKQH